MIKEFYETGHFYSCVPFVKENYKSVHGEFSNIDFNNSSHEEILNELNYYLENFDNTFGIKNTKNFMEEIENRQKDLKYSLCNPSFAGLDARLLYYFLLKNKPKKIIEVGCGNSTFLSCNIKQIFNLDLDIICIEPYPNQYIVEMCKRGYITLIKKRLEEVNPNIFESINKNDILFIDSSHVAKLNSDVLFYFTKIFPVLKSGVLVHIHDIFFPNNYPEDWIKKGIYWNEQYFLYVFLQYNNKFKIKFCNSYVPYKFYEKLKDIQKNWLEIKEKFLENIVTGGSIWIEAN